MRSAPGASFSSSQVTPSSAWCTPNANGSAANGISLGRLHSASEATPAAPITAAPVKLASALKHKGAEHRVVAGATER